MHDSIAELGLRVDSGGVVTAEAALDRLTPAALRAEAAQVKLTSTAASASMAQRDQAASVIAETTATLTAVRAKIDLNKGIADTTESSRRAAAARGALTQLEDYENRLENQLIQQNAKLKSSQDAVTESIHRSAEARMQAAQVSNTYAQQYQESVNARAGISSPDQMAGITASRGEDINAYGAAMDALRAKYNPLFAASKAYEEEINRINFAEKVGALNHNEATAALERERLAFEAASVSGGRFAQTGKLASYQVANLSYQVNDIVSGLLMGQSPFQILTQQGGQFVQIMQQAGMGPVGLLKQVGGMLYGLLTPARLVTGGLLGVAAAIAYIAYEAVANEKATDVALVGTGRRAGITGSQLNAMADQAAAAGNIGTGAARSYAQAYAASGSVVGQQIEQLTALTKNYAATAREDADAAVTELSGAFGNLGTGIDTIGKKIGGLDAATRQHVQDLFAQGRYYEANAIALKLINDNTVDYTKNLSFFGRIWEGILRMGSNVNAGLTDLVNPTDLAQLEQARVKLANLKEAASHGDQMVTPKDLAEATADVAKWSHIVADGMAKAGKESKEAFLKALTLQADDLAKALAPDITNVRTIINNIATLSRNPAETPQSTQALLAQKGALASLADAQGDVIVNGQRYLSQQQLQARGLEIERQAIYAKTAEQQRALAVQRSLNSTAGSNIPIADRQRLATLAGANAYEVAAKAIGDQNTALSYSTRTILDSASAYMRNDLPAVIALTAHYQALTEAISSGIDVRKREQELILQAVAQRVGSASQTVASLQIETQAQADATTAVLQGTLAYDRMSDAVSNRVRDVELEMLHQAALKTGNKELIKTIEGIIDAYKKLDQMKPANDNRNAVLAQLNGHAGDITMARTAGQMQQNGEISGSQRDAVNGKLGLQSDLNSIYGGFAASNPFGKTGQMGLDNNITQIKQKEAQDLQTIQDGLQSGLIKSEEDAAAARVQINQDAARKIQDAYTNMYSAQLQMGADAFGALADSVGQLTGKSSAAYKVLFGISKAFSIAQATLNLEVAISNALALPFPANIPAMAAAAAAGATIISDIASIAGFKDGVVGLQGAGTATSDSIYAKLSVGESVVTARGTRGNEGTLAAMNQGAQFDRMAANSGPRLIINNTNGSRVRVQAMTPAEIELMIDDHIIAAAPHIAKSAVKQVPNAVAKAQRQPRTRTR